jgi:hypothetical protein
MNLKHSLAIALVAISTASIAKPAAHSVVGTTKAERSLLDHGTQCAKLTASLDGTNTPATVEINTAIQTVCTHAEHLASIVMQQKTQHPSTYETLVAMNGTTIYLSPQQTKRMCQHPVSDKMTASCKTALDLLK